MRSTLIILHAPGYAPRFDLDTIETAEGTGADSIGWSEAYRMADELARRPDYLIRMGNTRTHTRVVPSPRGDAGDNPISFRKGRQTRLVRAVRATGPGEPRKYAPERWVYAVTYRWSGEWVTHVHAHPSPLFVGRGPWLRVMHATLREVRQAKRRGEHVVLTGDLQTRKRFLKVMLRAAGLRIWNEHVDYLCHTRGLKFAGREVLKVEGIDHPWLLAHLERV
ncbi:MAG: hypothetical protein AVDCRST_MAG83-1736 [uncultured Arthrobacter sp.]|uniref:Uncharacterized protein n=1 Tax=uncultured Arthrobacter sp. TaxID=114050 RepID=A0A6J4I743_9MICC|nr:hypothetical protein [uncultured Arthrobacter sp.]CAA9242867.1 MAG: hypothetical protein AVDCRST_MAG83-1736 [uncultured Arthrobacter sp.]